MSLLFIGVTVLFADAIMGRVAVAVGNRVLPWEGGALALGEADLRRDGLVVTGVRLVAGPGDTITIDTVAAELAFSELLRVPRRVRSIRAAGVSGTAVRSADGWGWLRPFGESGEGAGEPAGGTVVVVDRLAVARVALVARDSLGAPVASLAEGVLGASSLVVGERPSFVLDSLALGFDVVGWTPGRVDLTIAGRLADGVMAVDSLVLEESAGGRILAEGQLGPAVQNARALDLRVEGRRLPLARLHRGIGEVDPGQRADVDATVRGSSARPDLEARLAFAGAGAVDLSTHFAPGDTTELVASVTATDLDLSAITRGRAAVDPVSGYVLAELSLGPERFVDGPITVNLSSGAGQRPVRVRGRADFHSGEATLDLRAEVATVVAAVAGRIRPLDSIPVYDLEVATRTDLALGLLATDGSWEPRPWDVRVQARGKGFSGEALRTELQGHLTAADRGAVGAAVLRGRLQGAEGGALLATLAIDTLRSGPLSGTTGRLDLRREGERLAARGRFVVGTGRVEIERLDVRGTTPERLDLTFRELDPSNLAPALPEGRLSGRVVLEPIRGGAADPSLPDWARDLRLRGGLELLPSALGSTPIEGSVAVRLEAGRLNYDAELTGGDQEVALSGAATLAGAPFEFRVGKGHFVKLDPSAWSGGRGPAGRLTGSLQLDLAGTDPATARGSVALELEEGTIGERPVGPVAVEAQLEGGRVTLHADAAVDRFGALLDAEARADAIGSWAAAGRLRLTEALDDERVDSLAVAFAMASPDTAGTGGWQLRLGGSGRLASFRLDTLATSLALAGGVLRLEELSLMGPALEVSGRGSLPLDRDETKRADAAIVARTSELAALAPAFTAGYHGRATLEIRSSGSGASLRHEARLGLGGIRGPRVEVDTAEVTLLARSDTARWVGDAALDFRGWGDRPVLVPVGDALLVGAGSGSGRSTAPAVPTLELSLGWDPGLDAAIRIDRFNTILDGEAWSLVEPAVLRWGSGFELDDLRIRSSAGEISVAGRLDPGTRQELRARAIGLPIQLRRADGEVTLTRGLDFDLRLDGPAAEPRLLLDAALQTSADASQHQSLRAEWTARRIDLSVRVDGTGGGSLAVDGTLPLRLSLHPDSVPVATTGEELDLEVVARALDLAGLQSLVNPETVHELEGRLQGSMRVAGAAGAPRLEGELGIDRVGLRVPPLGLTVRSRRLSLAAEGDRLRVSEGLVEDGHDGEVRLSGEIGFPRLDSVVVDLQADVAAFRAADAPGIAAVLTGSVSAAGEIGAPMIRGRIRIDEGEYRLADSDAPTGLEPVELTDDDYRELEERFGLSFEEPPPDQGGPWEAMDLDVTVVAESNLWVRRPYEPALAIELAGDVRAVKPPQEEIRLAGTVRVVPGRSHVEEFGRRFDITRGTVRFDGPPTSAELEAEAVYQPTDDVDIQLGVVGNDDGFSLTLDSDPAMDETEVISYILVGRSSTDIQQYGEGGSAGGQAVGIGAELAFSRISGNIQELARRNLGLDVVEIRQDGLKGLTLEAGRYLTRRLYLGFVQPAVQSGTDAAVFGIDATEVEAEYRATEWLLANLSGSRSLARFFLGVRRAY